MTHNPQRMRTGALLAWPDYLDPSLCDYIESLILSFVSRCLKMCIFNKECSACSFNTKSTRNNCILKAFTSGRADVTQAKKENHAMQSQFICDRALLLETVQLWAGNHACVQQQYLLPHTLRFRLSRLFAPVRLRGGAPSFVERAFTREYRQGGTWVC